MVMLPRRYRFRGRIGAEFFRRARRLTTPEAWVYVQEDETLDGVQVAIIVPKKQFRTSVARHAAKRRWAARLREEIVIMKPGRYVYVLKHPTIRTIHGSIGIGHSSI
jgi:ribonuclease P protein component